MSRAPIGIAESVRTVDGETIATVRLGVPSDADVEHLRRAMVDAHQTMLALAVVPSRALSPYDASEEADAARCDFGEAARAYVAAKRARGGL